MEGPNGLSYPSLVTRFFGRQKLGQQMPPPPPRFSGRATAQRRGLYREQRQEPGLLDGPGRKGGRERERLSMPFGSLSALSLTTAHLPSVARSSSWL